MSDGEFVQAEQIDPKDDDTDGIRFAVPNPNHAGFVWDVTFGMSSTTEGERAGFPAAFSVNLSETETLKFHMSARAVIMVIKELVATLGVTDRRLGVHAARVAMREAQEWCDIHAEEAEEMRTPVEQSSAP